MKVLFYLYSSVGNDLRFEHAIEEFFGCEVHAFDPRLVLSFFLIESFISIQYYEYLFENLR